MGDFSIKAPMDMVELTMKNLTQNRMESFLVRNNQELYSVLDDLIANGDSVGYGGSVSLKQMGVIDYARKRDIKLFDRELEKSREKIIECMENGLTADVFLTSSNAITQNGELFNIDGRGNRVSAMVFGPKKLIVVAGTNKIVKDMDCAIDRVRNYAAPKNAQRLNKSTPCVKTNKCEDCLSPDRICSSFLTLSWQGNKDRIKVILVDQSIGY